MTELEELGQRRELVVLAARLQRATVMRRVERLRANPARRVFNLAASAARRPAVLSLGTAAARLALRLWRRRSQRKRLQPMLHRPPQPL
jgi:hypothetical protein